jgi:hypothetical protein
METSEQIYELGWNYPKLLLVFIIFYESFGKLGIGVANEDDGSCGDDC